jgi:hypothetical protein
MPITSKTRKVTVKREKQEVVQLPANPFLFEVLELVNKQRTVAKRVEFLRRYEHPSLKSIFIWNFDDSVITVLPPGDVPYSNLKDEQTNIGTLSNKVETLVNTMDYNGTTSLGSASDLKQERTTIRKEFKRFYNFIKGGNDSLAPLRRETMFIQILEGLHPIEAEILCLVKDKKLETKYNKITKDLVSEAYPDIIWGGRS